MRHLYYTVFVAFTILIFAGCGSGVSNTKESSIQDPNLNSDNFTRVALYHYKKTDLNLHRAKNTQIKRTRAAYPGAKKTSTHQKDVFYVDSVTPFNTYVQKMAIAYNDQTLNLTYDKESERVKITYFDGSQNSEKELSMQEFYKLNMPNNEIGE